MSNFGVILAAICTFVIDGEATLKGATGDSQSRPLWNQTGIDRLKKDLMTDYDKYSRPSDHKQVTKVQVGVAIYNVESDESKSAIIVTGLLRLVWNDSKLQWNSSDYSDISVIHMSDHEIWQPDIYLYNSASGNAQLARSGNVNILLYSDGQVIWVPPVKMAALCDFDVTRWPYDVQSCHLKFGSWVYSGNEIVLSLYNNEKQAELEDTVKVSEWNVVTSTAEIDAKKYSCCEETYYSAIFNLTLARKTTSYTATTVAPAVVAAFFILLQFWLPPDAAEKITLNGFAVVILSMFLINLNHKIAGAGSTTPLIVVYYSRCFCLAAFSTILSVIMFCFSKIPKDRPVPILAVKFLNSKPGKFVHLDLDVRELNFWKKKKNVLEQQVTVSEPDDLSKMTVTRQWNILAVCVDRFMFVLCSFVLLIMAILYA